MKAKLQKLNLDGVKKFAEAFAKTLRAPMIVLLHGDLGCGKTSFVSAVAAALHCDEQVTSPTFALLNEYHAKKMTIYHFDMYRLSSGDEAREAGFEEFFDKKRLAQANAVVFVEWPENVEDLNISADFEIFFEKSGDNLRDVVVVSN